MLLALAPHEVEVQPSRPPATRTSSVAAEAARAEAAASAETLRAQAAALEAALAELRVGPARALGIDGEWSRPRTVRSVFARRGWPEPERLSERYWLALRDYLTTHGIEVHLLDLLSIDARLRLRQVLTGHGREH